MPGKGGEELPTLHLLGLGCKRPALQMVPTTGAMSLHLRRMRQVNVNTVAMVDATRARAEFPLWTNPAFSSNFLSLFLISVKEKTVLH